MTTADDIAVLRRSTANPIFTAADVPYPANSVSNPGAARLGDETILLLRIEDLRGISQLHLVRSRDGNSDWRFDPEPLLRSEPHHHPEEVWGCEDPRLTWLPEREEWAIAYTAYSQRGPLVSLAMTHDFRQSFGSGPSCRPRTRTQPSSRGGSTVAGGTTGPPTRSPPWPRPVSTTSSIAYGTHPGRGPAARRSPATRADDPGGHGAQE